MPTKADGWDTKERGNDELYVVSLVKSVPLHDIGKVGITDWTVKKPERQTTEEFDQIKKHCEYGADILQTSEKKLDFPSFFRVAVELFMSQHELWAGKDGVPEADQQTQGGSCGQRNL